MDVLASIFRLLTGKAEKSKSKECPYCYPIISLQPADNFGQSIGKNDRWFCPSCESLFETVIHTSNSPTPVIKKSSQTNSSISNTSLETIIPILLEPNDPPTPSRRIGIPLSSGYGYSQYYPEEFLCRTCQNHQSILLQLLSVYGDGEDEEKVYDEAAEMTRIKQYHDDLERRYPLCTACKGRVQERLRMVEYKVKSRRLGSLRSISNKLLASNDSSKQRNNRNSRFLDGILIVIDIGFVQGFLLTLPLSLKFDHKFIIDWIDDDYFGQILYFIDHWKWISIFGTTGLTLALKPTLFNVAFELFLLIMRVALIELTEEQQQIINHENSSLLISSIFISIICYWLLWQLHCSYLLHGTINNRNVKNNAFVSSSPPLNKIATSNSGTFPIQEAKRLSGIDHWKTVSGSLDHLNPNTPLSTRFSDLSANDFNNNNNNNNSRYNDPRSTFTLGKRSIPSKNANNNPFSVSPSVLNASSFNHDNKSSRRVDPFLINLYPSKMDGLRSSGLESKLAGFKLADEGIIAANTTKSGTMMMMDIDDHNSHTMDKAVTINLNNKSSTSFSWKVPILTVFITVSLLLARFFIHFCLFMNEYSSITMIILILSFVAKRSFWLHHKFSSWKILINSLTIIRLFGLCYQLISDHNLQLISPTLLEGFNPFPLMMMMISSSYNIINTKVLFSLLPWSMSLLTLIIDSILIITH